VLAAVKIVVPAGLIAVPTIKAAPDATPVVTPAGAPTKEAGLSSPIEFIIVIVEPFGSKVTGAPVRKKAVLPAFHPWEAAPVPAAPKLVVFALVLKAPVIVKLPG